MGELVQSVDVAIANEEDCQKALGHRLPRGRRVRRSWTPSAVPGCSPRRSCGAFANLQDDRHHSAGKQVRRRERLVGRPAHGQEFFVSRRYEIRDIVDRVGGGGQLCRRADLRPETCRAREALEFAVACSCLKHSIPGDLPLLSVAEVKALMGGSGLGQGPAIDERVFRFLARPRGPAPAGIRPDQLASSSPAARPSRISLRASMPARWRCRQPPRAHAVPFFTCSPVERRSRRASSSVPVGQRRDARRKESPSGASPRASPSCRCAAWRTGTRDCELAMWPSLASLIDGETTGTATMPASAACLKSPSS